MALNLFSMSPSGWDSTDGPVNLGSKFSVSAATKLVGGRYWKGSAAADGSTVTMTLYGANTAALASGSRTQLASDPLGWIVVPFTAGLYTLAVGTAYTIAFRSSHTHYFATESYPLTASTNPPFIIPDNHSVYGYGSIGKPTSAGGFSYAIDVQAEGAPPPAPVITSVKALDTDNENLTQAWFDARAAEGVKLFITSGTPWNPLLPVTDNIPRTIIRTFFAMAVRSGMQIALYTRNPSHYNAGLDAAGDYITQLQFFALDVEPDPGTAVTQDMVDGVVARGVRPVIYAGSGFWASVQGSNSTAFSSYPLWDTDARDNFSYATWGTTPNVLTPTPVPYGGWNVSGNYRIGVQQKFEHVLDGVNVDLNSFDASFLREVSDVVVGPDQTVAPWQTVTLTAYGSGEWTQVSGTRQQFAVSGTSITFTAKPSMEQETLVFSFGGGAFGQGGKSVRVTVGKATHGIVQSNASILPVRFMKM